VLTKLYFNCQPGDSKRLSLKEENMPHSSSDAGQNEHKGFLIMEIRKLC